MTTSLGTLVAAEPALARLAEQSLPIRTAYQVAKLLAAVRVEVAHFREQQERYIRELGQPSPEDASKIVVCAEHMPEYWRRIEALAALEVAVSISPLPVSGLEGAHMTAADLAACGPLLEDA